MRHFRHLCLVLALCTVAAAANEAVPRSVSDDVRSSIEKADQALESGDSHLALALLEGSLYPNGVKLAVDEKSLDSDAQFKAVCLALGTWESELNGDFPVTLVTDPKEADVVLSFVDAIPERGEDALGLIKVSKHYRWNKFRHEVTYTGTISIVRSAPGGRLSSAEVRDVTLHELGHLLGLGDQQNVGWIMGPMERGKPMSKPTATEVEDVKSLRRLLRARISDAGSGQ